MKLLDLNLLLYAVNRDSVRHAAAKAWLEGTMSGPERVALTWPVIIGFIWLVTSGRVFALPLPPEVALEVVEGWMELPNVVVLHPGDDHWRILRELLRESGTAGNLTNDAHLAAHGIEHGCELCSTDNDFGRFPRLQWSNPLAGG